MVADPPPPADDAALLALREAARGGEPASLFALARALTARHLDFSEVRELYQRGANAGHAASQVEYARMLMWGIRGDPAPAEAVQWLERAEAAGEPIAGYYLALIALGSVALPRDGRINERMLAAAKADFAPALVAAAVHVGRRDNPADQTRCVQLLGRATNLGDATAAQLLIERLTRGEGCEVQPRAVRQLRAQLAQHGIGTLPPIVARIPPVVYPLRGDALPEPGVLAFEDALQPAPMRTLSTAPHVMQLDDLLSADECRLLVSASTPLLRRARSSFALSGQPAEHEVHTGAEAVFDPVVEDFALRLVQLRLARSARMELTHAEPLSVMRYAPGEGYPPHRDYRAPSALDGDRPQAGNRTRTLCVFLNNVEAGGELEFPQAGLRITPRAGRAVVYDSLLPSGTPDPQSLHAGLPVQRGEKWQATLWLRQKRYRQY